MLKTSDAHSPRIGNRYSIKAALSIFLDSMPIGVAVEFPGLLNNTYCLKGESNVVSASTIQVNLSQLNKSMGFRTTRKTINGKTFFTREANKEGDITTGLRRPKVVLAEANLILRRIAESPECAELEVSKDAIYSAWRTLNSLITYFEEYGNYKEEPFMEKWAPDIAHNKLLTIRNTISIPRASYIDADSFDQDYAIIRKLVAEYRKMATAEDILKLEAILLKYPSYSRLAVG